MDKPLFWITIDFEWDPHDLWIGVFWKRKENHVDVWICFVPCLPLHVVIYD